MKISRRFGAVLGVAAALALPVAAQAQIAVNIFSNFTSGGGVGDDGSPFSGQLCSFGLSAISLNPFHPIDHNAACPPSPPGHTNPFQFGAQLTGGFNVATSGMYSFTLHSDDGSGLFVNGNSAIQNGGNHVDNAVTQSIFLNAGNNPFTLNYFEVNGDPAILELMTPRGVSYTTPEPSSMALLGTGLIGLVPMIRRKKRK